jgi:hypothetical protein
MKDEKMSAVLICLSKINTHLLVENHLQHANWYNNANFYADKSLIHKGSKFRTDLPFILIIPIYIDKKKQSDSVEIKAANWCVHLVLVFEIRSR